MKQAPLSFIPLVETIARRAASSVLRCTPAILFLFPVMISAQVQPQTKERSVAPVRKVGPVGPRVATVNVLPASVVVSNDDVAALASRLREFSSGLTGSERELFVQLLLRAAAAPSDSPEGTDVKVRLFTAGLRTEGETEPAGVIVQDGRGQSGGVITPSPVAVLREMLGPGVVSIGPKQDDPRAPSAATGALAIGPKQDDPRSPSSSLAEKMQVFGGSLSLTEKAMMDWLLQRASSSQAPASGTPNDPRPTPERALRAALGIEAIGPKQDDPSPRPDAQRWTLRF